MIRGDDVEDVKIIDLYFQRDEKAIDETDKKYGQLCYSVAKNILNDKEDVKECVSDTYMNLWNTIPPVKPLNFSAFICKLTRNLSLKKLDYNNAKKRSPELVTALSEMENIISSENVTETIENKELGSIISEFLKEEKETQRNVFIRRYWFLDSIQSISEKYGFSQSKVKSMLFHTRKRLKAYLEERGY